MDVALLGFVPLALLRGLKAQLFPQEALHLSLRFRCRKTLLCSERRSRQICLRRVTAGAATLAVFHSNQQAFAIGNLKELFR
jgi:hypothetical protein